MRDLVSTGAQRVRMMVGMNPTANARRAKRGPLLPWLDAFNASLRSQSERYRAAAQRYIEAADAIAAAAHAIERLPPSAAKSESP